MLRNQWSFRFPANEVQAACQARLDDLQAEREELLEKAATAEAEGLELSSTDSSRSREVERAHETYSQWAAALALRGKDTLSLQIDDVVFFNLIGKGGPA